MLTRSSFLGVWKHNRWKTNYCTVCAGPSKSGIILTNSIITKRAKSGQLEEARQLFDGMRERSVVSWNAMISGYSEWGKYSEVFSLVWSMHRSNTKLNESTFSSVLSVCAHSGSSSEGKQVHGLVLKSGCESFKLVGSALLYFYSSSCEIEEARRVFDDLHERNELLWSLMLVGYVQCNLLNDASRIFNKMPSHDVIAWTTLISGYSKTEKGAQKALELFTLMRKNGDITPNEFTLDCVIRACSRQGILPVGKALHGLVVRGGFELDSSICGALIDFYCNCLVMDDAKIVYSQLVNPCLNDSNVLIAGLVMAGKIEEAELIFNGLINRNAVSYNLMIKGYALCGRVEESKRVFSEMPERTLTSTNTMISVYSRNRETEKALELFEETKGKRNSVTWNSMISGYIHNDQHENAVKLYLEMRRVPISQTRSTFSALFHACSCLGSLQQGQLIHAHLIKTPFETNVYVGTALVDMYSKCGTIADAQASFAGISCPNVAAWTALINAYAHHGLGFKAISLFEHMLERGVHPNAATLVGVLSACTHSGMVSEGTRIFHEMEARFGITPALEHFTCIVDLLGRTGHLHEAEELVNGMPVEPDKVILVALLNACWFWADMEVGTRVAEKMLSFDPHPVSGCVIMSNMYAGSGRWREKMQARKVLKGLEAKKPPGCSWIEVNTRTRVFVIDNRIYPCCHPVHSTLKHLTANVNSSNFFDFNSSQLTRHELYVT
ncbi:PREDICTED: pentatricopeptide repeat-containing protein At2g36980, mitochondrial-like isoform X1 [Ipomoea nil]|uniref:pentatricopeptide repeat-containing protein At2g36980, mitochondrial-like isoform X1 n=2 Tax=Ipomoea nil TaxID=35883 RepID=UPI0009011325|nr:PREDICTED: pentatricopeptide repeat-containing protein At2g36980, mitochondrial-like isoform X1 [Ipomoea nil]